MEFEPFVYEEKDRSSFEINVENGIYYVTGGYVEELARRVVLSDYDSFRWFQRCLRDKGVIDALKEAGMQDGDTVCIMDIEFEYTL